MKFILILMITFSGIRSKKIYEKFMNESIRYDLKLYIWRKESLLEF